MRRPIWTKPKTWFSWCMRSMRCVQPGTCWLTTTAATAVCWLPWQKWRLRVMWVWRLMWTCWWQRATASPTAAWTRETLKTGPPKSAPAVKNSPCKPCLTKSWARCYRCALQTETPCLRCCESMACPPTATWWAPPAALKRKLQTPEKSTPAWANCRFGAMPNAFSAPPCLTCIRCGTA